MRNDRLIVSETFYSIQGEGPYVGWPAVFLRLAGCNLRCNGFSYVDPTTQQHLGCDSKAVWRHGNKMAFDDLLDHWEQQSWLAALANGAHLVITGGEPLIQQVALLPFIQALDERIETRCFIELETNATQQPTAELWQRLDQINASPKMSNSGEAKRKAYNQTLLTALAASDKVTFKFVIAKESDVDEVINHYQIPLAIPSAKIMLMSEGGRASDLNQREPWIVESCKQHGFRFSPRCHIHIWGEVTGV